MEQSRGTNDRDANQTPQIERLFVTAAHWQEMQQVVEQHAPIEACGLLGGVFAAGEARTLAVIPVTNALHSPTRYRMAPQEQLQAFNQIEAQGWELVGIFHSHPQGPEEPSAVDIAEAYYPGVVYLIWCCQADSWTCRGFLIQPGSVQEIPLLLTDG